MEKKVKIYVEYEPTPFRHLVIECPKCDNKFLPYDICNDDVPMYSWELSCYCKCTCPMCGHSFDLSNTDIYEPDMDEEFYKGVRKKIVRFE